MAIAMGGECTGKISLRLKHVTDLAAGDRKIELPQGIAWLLLRQCLGDREAVAVGGEGAGRIALRLEDAAYLVVGDRKVALP
jgi:hypothetical protein